LAAETAATMAASIALTAGSRRGGGSRSYSSGGLGGGGGIRSGGRFGTHAF
jgi:hypothetical protein